MKNCYAFLASLLLLARPAAAQTTPADTTRLGYGEEVAAPAATPPLAIARQERGVWKLGLNNFLLDGQSYIPSWRVGLHVAYEHQLGGPAWSVLGELSPAIVRTQCYAPYPTLKYQTSFALRAQVASRYYYNLERRRRRGQRTVGFAANYVAVAIGASLFGPGGTNREAPFTPFVGETSSGTAPVDVAVLYGLQRRLGRRGFVDASLGLGNFFAAGRATAIVGSLRLGVVLGSPPSYPAPPVPATAEASLHPRAYLGGQVGFTGYRLQYARQNPYPENTREVVGGEVRETSYFYGFKRGIGAYADYQSPASSLYAGYYLTPRLAMQAGATYWVSSELTYTKFDGPAGQFDVGNGHYRATGLALPVLVRYSLTAAFLRRWQFEALGGLTLVRSTAEFREYAIEQHQVTDQQTADFRRTAWGLHATLGVAASYGFGRRRQVQATAELTTAKDLRTALRITSFDDLPLSGSLGLRYRFAYH